MAFINGYDTHYKCLICGTKCISKINKTVFGIDFIYSHPDNCIYYINDFPHLCKNNKKNLNRTEIKKVNNPNIISKKGFY